MTLTMSPIILIEPNALLAGEFLAYVREFLDAGEGRYLPYLDQIQRDFHAYVHSLAERSRDLPSNTDRVPQSTFWLAGRRPDGDTRILGTSRLRHRLNQHLALMGGHIGYEIRPSERGKGYGTQILAQTLVEARRLGLHRVLLTCDVANVASARIIEKNGGVLGDRLVPDHYDQEIARYWIELEGRGEQI